MRQLVLNTTTVPRHKCCTSPFWLYRIYQDTKVHIQEVSSLIEEALSESRTKVLPALYEEKFNPILFPPPRKLTCVADSIRSEPGTLAGAWLPLWTGAMDQVRKWEVLVNNNGLSYKTKGAECSIKIPGFTPGTDLVWFVRPIGKDGTIGDWSEVGKCKV